MSLLMTGKVVPPQQRCLAAGEPTVDAASTGTHPAVVESEWRFLAERNFTQLEQ